MAEDRLYRRIIHSAALTDWAATRWIGPLRIAFLATLLVYLAIKLSGPQAAAPLAIGVLFAGISDLRGGIDERLRGMILTGISISFAAMLGVLVSGSFPLHLATSAAAAALCGYVGVAGPKAALAGLLSLAVFAVFSGTADPIGDALPVAGWMLVGAVIVTASVALPLLARRIGGMRSEIAIAYRGQAFALRGRMGGISGGDAAAKVARARGRISEGSVTGQTRAWCVQLVDECDRARIGLIALEGDGYARNPGQEELVGRFAAATAALMIAIGSTLEIPARRSALADRKRGLLAAATACEGGVDRVSANAVSEVRDSLVEALALLDRPWPIGRRAELNLRMSVPPEGLGDLLHHRDPDNLFTRHAIRLTILFVIATVISQVDGANHAYWLPMTVALVTKPDIAQTAPRIAGRIAGTIGGLVFVAAIAALLGDGLAIGIALVAIGGFVAAMFIPSNYAIWTMGVTILVLPLLHMSDPDFSSLLGQRLLETLIAGALVLAVAWIWPTRLTDDICRQLARAARALAAYARAILDEDPERLIESRAQLQEARLQATGIVNAAANEPGSLRLHYAIAHQVNIDLTRATAIAVGCGAIETGRAEGEAARQQLTSRSLEQLDALARRLEELHDSGHAPYSPAPPDAPASRFEQFVLDAQASLNHSPHAGNPLPAASA